MDVSVYQTRENEGSVRVDDPGGVAGIVTHACDDRAAHGDVDREELAGEGRVDSTSPYQQTGRVESEGHAPALFALVHSVY